MVDSRLIGMKREATKETNHFKHRSPLLYLHKHPVELTGLRSLQAVWAELVRLSDAGLDAISLPPPQVC